jgi:hypothetical protein
VDWRRSPHRCMCAGELLCTQRTLIDAVTLSHSESLNLVRHFGMH